MSAVNSYDIYVKLSPPLQSGVTYSLHVGGLVDESGNQMVEQTYELWYAEVGPSANSTTAIKINQQGYLPLAPKTAYIGGSPLPFTASSPCRVVCGLW